MASNKITGDLIVTGTLRPGGFVTPAASVGDTEAKSTDPFDVDKMLHQYNVAFAQNHGTAAWISVPPSMLAATNTLGWRIPAAPGSRCLDIR